MSECQSTACNLPLSFRPSFSLSPCLPRPLSPSLGCALPEVPEYWEWQRIVREGNPEALLNLLTMFDLADLDAR